MASDRDVVLAQKMEIDHKMGDTETIFTQPVIKIYVKEGNRFISIDRTIIRLPGDVQIFRDSLYDGIYVLKGDSLVRNRVLRAKNLVFLTTYDDVGMGYRAYLYIFDLKYKRVMVDTECKESYLYSPAGVFLIDVDRNAILSIGRSQMYVKKSIDVIPASLFRISQGCYKLIENVYRPGYADANCDTFLLSYFKGAISGNRRRVFKLPKGWNDIPGEK